MVGDAFFNIVAAGTQTKDYGKKMCKAFLWPVWLWDSLLQLHWKQKSIQMLLLLFVVCVYPNTKPIKIVLPVFILLAGNQAINIGFFVRPFQSMSVKNILILKSAFFIQPLRTTSLLYTKPACIITVCGSKIDWATKQKKPKSQHHLSFYNSCYF